MGMLPGDKIGPPPKHTPRPMTPRGTILKPKNVPAKKRNRKAERDANQKFVDMASRHESNFFVAFVIDEDTGDVKATYRMNNFDSNRFEQAAECFASILTRLLVENPAAVAALEAAQAANEAAQSSESSPDSAPGSADGRQAPGRTVPGEDTPADERPPEEGQPD
jgi:hypothetical protein